ncbi:MAG: entericidin A/B family lipoprotein [Aromatoleum sp.]|nr:entericidin A/B family lipoprotein [Aromatoleum sp.]
MKALLALIIATALATLAGCNTVEGVGRDVKATGQAVEKAADENKPK